MHIVGMYVYILQQCQGLLLTYQDSLLENSDGINFSWLWHGLQLRIILKFFCHGTPKYFFCRFVSPQLQMACRSMFSQQQFEQGLSVKQTCSVVTAPSDPRHAGGSFMKCYNDHKTIIYYLRVCYWPRFSQAHFAICPRDLYSKVSDSFHSCQ